MSGFDNGTFHFSGSTMNILWKEWMRWLKLGKSSNMLMVEES